MLGSLQLFHREVVEDKMLLEAVDDELNILRSFCFFNFFDVFSDLGSGTFLWVVIDSDGFTLCSSLNCLWNRRVEVFAIVNQNLHLKPAFSLLRYRR